MEEKENNKKIYICHSRQQISRVFFGAGHKERSPRCPWVPPNNAWTAALHSFGLLREPGPESARTGDCVSLGSGVALSCPPPSEPEGKPSAQHAASENTSGLGVRRTAPGFGRHRPERPGQKEEAPRSLFLLPGVRLRPPGGWRSFGVNGTPPGVCHVHPKVELGRSTPRLWNGRPRGPGRGQWAPPCPF